MNIQRYYRGFGQGFGQTIDCKIDIYCFSAKQAALSQIEQRVVGSESG